MQDKTATAIVIECVGIQLQAARHISNLSGRGTDRSTLVISAGVLMSLACLAGNGVTVKKIILSSAPLRRLKLDCSKIAQDLPYIKK